MNARVLPDISPTPGHVQYRLEHQLGPVLRALYLLAEANRIFSEIEASIASETDRAREVSAWLDKHVNARLQFIGDDIGGEGPSEVLCNLSRVAVDLLVSISDEASEVDEAYQFAKGAELLRDGAQQSKSEALTRPLKGGAK